MNRTNDYMLQLQKELIDKKQITESTATLYIKNLFFINNKQPFNNLSFLKNTEAVNEFLKAYKETTKKTYLASITSVLSLFKDKPSYKKIYEHYYNQMMDKVEEIKEENVNEKSDVQNLNWISWDMVMNIKNMIRDVIITFSKNKLITPQQYDLLLAYLVLCLYTEIVPRRNQDFIDMYVVANYDDNLDKNKNYLDLNKKEFVFQHYKTFKKYGKQVINISDKTDLLEILHLYLKFHPSNPNPTLKKIPKNMNIKLLVYSDGSPLVAVNSITRILNKIFGRKIGSSMLRHIYLSSKYDIKEMKKDAVGMGHSVNEQRQYLKEDIELDTDEELNLKVDVKQDKNKNILKKEIIKEVKKEEKKEEPKKEEKKEEPKKEESPIKVKEKKVQIKKLKSDVV
jgi:hypothetical protein